MVTFPFPNDSQLFGFVGFWSQFWSGFSLPFPLNILLLPVRLMEWGLRVVVFMLG